MGKTGKGRVLVSVSIPDEWRREIDKRAEALHMTRAAYLRLLIENWWNRGRPPLSEPDRYMQVAAKR